MLRYPLVAAWQEQLPTVVGCFEEDFEAFNAHPRSPIGHRKLARTIDLLERLFEEEHRRTKTISCAFRAWTMLRLVYAVLARASDSWRGMRITEVELRQLHARRENLEDAHAKHIKPVVASATGKRPTQVSSRIGT